jgi:hypothetical protein
MVRQYLKQVYSLVVQISVGSHSGYQMRYLLRTDYPARSHRHQADLLYNIQTMSYETASRWSRLY